MVRYRGFTNMTNACIRDGLPNVARQISNEFEKGMVPQFALPSDLDLRLIQGAFIRHLVNDPDLTDEAIGEENTLTATDLSSMGEGIERNAKKLCFLSLGGAIISGIVTAITYSISKDPSATESTRTALGIVALGGTVLSIAGGFISAKASIVRDAALDLIHTPQEWARITKFVISDTDRANYGVVQGPQMHD